MYIENIQLVTTEVKLCIYGVPVVENLSNFLNGKQFQLSKGQANRKYRNVTSEIFWEFDTSCYTFKD